MQYFLKQTPSSISFSHSCSVFGPLEFRLWWKTSAVVRCVVMRLAVVELMTLDELFAIPDLERCTYDKTALLIALLCLFCCAPRVLSPCLAWACQRMGVRCLLHIDIVELEDTCLMVLISRSLNVWCTDSATGILVGVHSCFELVALVSDLKDRYSMQCVGINRMPWTVCDANDATTRSKRHLPQRRFMEDIIPRDFHPCDHSKRVQRIMLHEMQYTLNPRP